MKCTYKQASVSIAHKFAYVLPLVAQIGSYCMVQAWLHSASAEAKRQYQSVVFVVRICSINGFYCLSSCVKSLTWIRCILSYQKSTFEYHQLCYFFSIIGFWSSFICRNLSIVMIVAVTMTLFFKDTTQTSGYCQCPFAPCNAAYQSLTWFYIPDSWLLWHLS